MKIIFFGSDDFAQAHLRALIASSHDVAACVTQPDRPKGRGMPVVISPIKEEAQRHKIPLLQSADINDAAFINGLKGFAADVFVVIAYGRILPQSLLTIPKIMPVNVHGSLLPKYRGAAPINWAVINGEEQTGLSIIRMNPRMDAGDILGQLTIAILPEDTSASVREKMMRQGPDFLVAVLEQINNRAVTVVAQDQRQVTAAPKLTKELGKINWSKSARQIHNLVRGLQPWPVAYTYFNNKILKILSTRVLNSDIKSHPVGEVIEVNEQGFTVATSQNILLITEVHLQDGKRMGAADFLRGHKIGAGYKFGD